MIMEELKKGNILIGRCKHPYQIEGDVTASFRDIKGNRYPMQVNITGADTYDIILDLTDIPIGKVAFDIKVGTVSSKTAYFMIEEAIA